MSRPIPQLRTRYYLDHFEEMLRFVLDRYEHVLDSPHRAFAEDFGALPVEERCLYVRIANRKGHVFRCDSLRYEEIPDLDRAAAHLEHSRFLRRPLDDDTPSLLRLHTREDLVSWIRSSPEIPEPPRLASIRKQDLVDHLSARLSLSDLRPFVDLSRYLVQERLDELGYLLFLFFGRLERNLTSFALRDLGVMRRSRFRSDFEARFPDRETARVSYHYEKAIDRLDHAAPGDVDALLHESREWPDPVDLETEENRARALHRLGRRLERADRGEEALEVYRRSDRFPSTERSARLLISTGHPEEAREFLRKLIENPSCDEELIFAEDLLARKFGDRRVGRLTEMLRSADSIALDETLRDEPEAGAAKYFRRKGIDAHHVENAIWRQLFGLVFWDLLFGSETSLHNEFEWKPAGLDSGAFFHRHREAIESRLARLDASPESLAELDRTWRTHLDTPNAIVPWYPELYRLSRELVRLAPTEGLRHLLREMMRNFRGNRSGYPDLLLIEGERVRFVEVKAEGDQLQRHQLAQLERLENAGFPVSVLRVRWACDPEQEYVVVDVETTGGNPSWNRVTEIGAVRVRGGEVIEEWSSLVNPGRSIPRKIVELTGITDEMVANAPAFDEIADDFLDFVGDAVFVGHRVKFDYGFLRAECERAGRELRRPTLCTVVSMRRHFPGLPSYGLASLCEHFGVSLRNHHRALDDARATAELLILLNRKRSETWEAEAI